MLSIALGVAACASGASNPLEAPAANGLTEDHVVEVTNRNWDDMHIYATYGTSAYRLGAIEGNASKKFRLPVAFAGRIGGIRLAARARTGSDLHYSEVIHLAPGQTLGWSLESNLKLSFHWVR